MCTPLELLLQRMADATVSNSSFLFVQVSGDPTSGRAVVIHRYKKRDGKSTVLKLAPVGSAGGDELVHEIEVLEYIRRQQDSNAMAVIPDVLEYGLDEVVRFQVLVEGIDDIELALQFACQGR